VRVNGWSSCIVERGLQFLGLTRLSLSLTTGNGPVGPAHHRHDGRQAAAEPQKGLLVGVLPPLVGVICQKRGLVGVLPLCHSLGGRCPAGCTKRTGLTYRHRCVLWRRRRNLSASSPLPVRARVHLCPPTSTIWRPLSALRWLVRAPSRRSTLWRVTPSHDWRSARAPSSPAGRRTLRSCPCTSWLQGATRSPLRRRSARCCRVAGGLAWAGLSRAPRFSLARGWWRAKLRTAVRLSLALRASPPVLPTHPLTYPPPPSCRCIPLWRRRRWRRWRWR
jgi:hypothetical protein